MAAVAQQMDPQVFDDGAKPNYPSASACYRIDGRTNSSNSVNSTRDVRVETHRPRRARDHAARLEGNE